MNKKIVIVALVALSSMQFMPDLQAKQLGKLSPPRLQAEDMNYYQVYHWSKPIPRKDLYESNLNGQEHMFGKMQACLSLAVELPLHIAEFKHGQYEPDDFMLEGNQESSEVIEYWLVYNFAKAHYMGYQGSVDPEADDDPALRRLRDKFWTHCLSELDVWLYTQAAQRKVHQQPDDEIPWQQFLREGDPLNKHR